MTGIVTTSGEMTISEYEYSYYFDGSDACKKRTEDGIMEITSYEYDDYGNRVKMTATGSANYTTVYDYADAQGNYTALIQKEIKYDAFGVELDPKEVNMKNKMILATIAILVGAVYFLNIYVETVLSSARMTRAIRANDIQKVEQLLEKHPDTVNKIDFIFPR